MFDDSCGGAAVASASDQVREEGEDYRATDDSRERDEPMAPALVGSSPALRYALRHLAVIVAKTSPVLILGETGTGKEVLARRIHALGPRRNHPFVAQNCAAIPHELVESELFGHAAGAFSGATRAKPGLLELAHGGTFFLDEIGDLPLAFQAKLLRVLDDKVVRRVGETTARKVDFRLITATNRDIKAEVDGHRFRRDLLYRVNVFTVTLPPLRERVEDIEDLARHFVHVAAESSGEPRPTVSPEAMERLRRHLWPGNVREFANVIERAVAIATRSVIEPEHLEIEVERDAESDKGKFGEALSGFKRRTVAHALQAHGGNVSRAARELGIARQQLQRLMRQLRIESRHGSRQDRRARSPHNEG